MGGRSRKDPFIHDIVSGGTELERLKASNYDTILERELHLCANNFWYFAVNHIKTYDEENGIERTFPDPTKFKYLVDFNDDIENFRKVICFKSRRLFITWFCICRQVWRGKFAGTKYREGNDIFKGSLFSISETEGKELMDRVHFIHSRLPQWMQKWNPQVTANEMVSKWEAGGSIQAFPLKRSGPRSFGFTESLFDEMAFQEAVRPAWAGLVPTLGARGILIAVSTSNGKGNLFADIWLNKNNRYPDIRRIDLLNYTYHPEHDKEWFDSMVKRSGLDQRDVMREFFGSLATPAGDPVWQEYSFETHSCDPLEVTESRPVFVGWDFGFHSPAVTFWQRNTADQWVGIDEIQGEDVSFDVFCENVRERANSLYNRRRVNEIHFVPPDGAMPYVGGPSRTGARNCIMEIKNQWNLRAAQVRYGAVDVGTRNREGARLNEVRKLWRLRDDGKPGVVASKKMALFHEGASGGYCYPENGGEVPYANDYTHTQDTFQMVVTGWNRMMRADKAGREDNLTPQGRIRPGPSRLGLPKKRYRIGLPGR